MTDLSDIFAKLEVRMEDITPAAASTFKAEGSFDEPQAAIRFMLAGNATVTLRSAQTNARFTFRIRASEDGRIHFVSLLNGPDNETAYAYFGYIRRGVFFHGGAKAKVGADAPSAKAFSWSWMKLSQNTMPPKLEIWHEGRCGRCARKLTVPESVASGFGPECAGKM